MAHSSEDVLAPTCGPCRFLMEPHGELLRRAGAQQLSVAKQKRRQGGTVVQQHLQSGRRSGRSAAIDLIRIFGIMAVVVGHVFETELIRQVLYTWHVPIFFFLSGYLWTGNRTVRFEVDKRFRTLIIPYTSWLILIALPVVTAWSIAGHLDLSRLMTLLVGGSHLGRPFSAFWFVTALFFSTVLFRLLENRAALRWAFLLSGLILAATIGEVLAELPLSLGLAVPCTIFIAAGAALKRYRSRIPYPTAAAAVSLGASVLMVSTGTSAPMDIKAGDFGTPVLGMIVATSVCFGLTLIVEVGAKNLGSTFDTITSLLAKGGLMVVLTHALFIWLLTLTPLNQWSVLAASLVVPWTLATLVGRTRLSPFLLGVRQQRRRVWRS
ncbi:acyltransferase family protein [Arthrobacter sp. NPDC055585]